MNCSLPSWLKHFRYCHSGQVIRFPTVSLKPILKATGESEGQVAKHAKLCVFSDLLSSASGWENLHNPENCCFGSSSFSECEQTLFLFYVKYTGHLWSISKRFQICLGIWGGGDPWRVIQNKTRKYMSIVLHNELVLLPSFHQRSFPPFAFVLCWVWCSRYQTCSRGRVLVAMCRVRGVRVGNLQQQSSSKAAGAPCLTPLLTACSVSRGSLECSLEKSLFIYHGLYWILML